MPPSWPISVLVRIFFFAHLFPIILQKLLTYDKECSRASTWRARQKNTVEACRFVHKSNGLRHVPNSLYSVATHPFRKFTNSILASDKLTEYRARERHPYHTTPPYSTKNKVIWDQLSYQTPGLCTPDSDY